MTRDDFFQQAMLKMAEVILLRTDKEPTPEQLALKAKEYAAALHNEMLTGLGELDIAEELAGRPIASPSPRQAFARDAIPTLAPVTRDLPEQEGPQCPTCGGPMRKRRSAHGNFWGCQKFPECRGTQKPGFGF